MTHSKMSNIISCIESAIVLFDIL